MVTTNQMYEALDNMDDYALMAGIKPVGPHRILTVGIEELEQLRAKVAELEAQLAKYQNLEPVGEIVKGEAGTMRHPVWKNGIYPDVGCKLYALKGY